MHIELPPSGPAVWPLAMLAPGPFPVHQPDSRSGGPKRAVVLAIEDNRADVIMIQEAIARHKLEIDLHVIDDGGKAFDFIRDAEAGTSHLPQPDLIMLDQNLPKRSGREIIERLRKSEKFADVPVLVVSSSNSEADKRDLAAAGANRYFHKPPSYDDYLKLGDVLRDLLRKNENFAPDSLAE